MANALYLAIITASYAAVLIISSEHVSVGMNFFSGSVWSEFIMQGNLKHVGLGMIGVTVLVDFCSALRLKRFDEYHTSILGKNLILNGMLAVLLLPIALCIFIAAPEYFVETVFALLIFQWFVIVVIDITNLIRYR